MKKTIGNALSTIIVILLAIVMTFAVLLDNNSRYQDMIGKRIGPWTGEIVGTVQEYKGEYAVNAMIDEGYGLLLTNELKDMFDVPQGTKVQFWGTIESFRPLIIHVDGIGW